ncbi:MAG: response regulator [Pseudomonadota bacterium]
MEDTGKHLLIADDDRILRKRVVHALAKKNDRFVIHEAEDGQQAIGLLKSAPIELVITDINMPKVSGLMVLAYLNAFLPDVPCFVMTAYGTSRLRAKMPADLLRFYQKPVDADDMASAVVVALSRGHKQAGCGGMTLIHFLQLIEAEKLTATVTVENPPGPPTRIFISDNMILDAVAGTRRGEVVAMEAVSLENPTYCIDHSVPDTVFRRFTLSLSELIRTATDCFDNR